MLKFTCTNCGESIISKFLKIGDTYKCRNCGAEIIVPDNATETTEEPDYDKPVPKPNYKPSPDVKQRSSGKVDNKNKQISVEEKEPNNNLKIVGSISGFVFLVAFFAMPVARGCKGGQLIEMGLKSDKTSEIIFGALLIAMVLGAATGIILYLSDRYKDGAWAADFGIVAGILAALIGGIKIKYIELGGWLTFAALAIMATAPRVIKNTQKNYGSKVAKNICHNCGAPLREDSTFCSKCGNKIENKNIHKIHCHNCGESIDGDAQFCENCGQKL